MATQNELLDQFDAAHTAFRAWSDIHLDHTNRDLVILLARAEAVRTSAHDALHSTDERIFTGHATKALAHSTRAREAAGPVPYRLAHPAMAFVDTFTGLLEEAAYHRPADTIAAPACRYCRGDAHGFCAGSNDTGTGPCPCSENKHNTKEAHRG